MKLMWQKDPRSLESHSKARFTDGFPKRYRTCVLKLLTFIIDNKFVFSDYGEIEDLLVEFTTLSASPKLTLTPLLHKSSSRFLALGESPFGPRCRQVLGLFPLISAHGIDVRGHCYTR